MPVLKINGINLQYDVTGQGQPLLFVHGLGSCSEDWEAQVAYFSQHYQVITFDLRGHGRSEKPNGPYSMHMLATDAAQLLAALSITSAHVVGVSLGGGVAFQLVVSHPSLVKTLTIVNSSPDAVLRTFKQKFALALRGVIVRFLGLQKMAKIIAEKLFVDADQANIRAAFIERFGRNEKAPYSAAMSAFIGWSVISQVGAIACPTLVIAADQDYTPVSFKEDYVAKMPTAQLVVIPDSRHALPMERPQAFNAVLEKFLNANP